MALASKTINFTGKDSLLIGNDYKLRLTITSGDQSIPLHSVNAVAYIKRYYDSPASATPAVSFFDRAKGVIDLVIEASETALLRPGKYLYGVTFTMSNNSIWTPIQGKIEFVANGGIV